MDGVAGEDRGERAIKEGRVGRPAEEIDAGQGPEQEPEGRRVAPEGIERSAAAATVKNRTSRAHRTPRMAPTAIAAIGSAPI